MSPTQAREIIAFADAHIAEWKSRLRLNTGRGVETWDSPTGQMVAVSAPEDEEVKEPLVLTPYLWANTTRVSTLDPVYVPATETRPGFLLDSGDTVTEKTGWYVHTVLPALASGEYFNKEEYLNPDALTPVTDLGKYPYRAGYYWPTNDSVGTDLAPFDLFSGFLFPPQQVITAGALYSPEGVQSGLSGDLEFTNRTTTTVMVKLAVRGYSPSYLDDRRRRGLLPEFEKGVGIGAYDLMLRQQDLTQGPYWYVGPYTDDDGTYREEGMTWATTPVLTSHRHRVGFAPVSLSYTSRANGPKFSSPGWTSPGVIEFMGYRKV
jgi:hypothetical protein